MSEQILQTLIGEDVPVSVFFDYSPSEPQTHEEPGCDAEVTINAVCINHVPDRDIEDCLNDKTLDALKMQCFELVDKNAREAYEQEEG